MLFNSYDPVSLNREFTVNKTVYFCGHGKTTAHSAQVVEVEHHGPS